MVIDFHIGGRHLRQLVLLLGWIEAVIRKCSQPTCKSVTRVDGQHCIVPHVLSTYVLYIFIYIYIVSLCDARWQHMNTICYVFLTMII